MRDLDYGDELPVIVGGVGAIGLPFDLTDEEADEYLAELAAKLKRKRPCGFAPWPQEEGTDG